MKVSITNLSFTTARGRTAAFIPLSVYVGVFAGQPASMPCLTGGSRPVFHSSHSEVLPSTAEFTVASVWGSQSLSANPLVFSITLQPEHNSRESAAAGREGCEWGEEKEREKKSHQTKKSKKTQTKATLLEFRDDKDEVRCFLLFVCIMMLPKFHSEWGFHCARQGTKDHSCPQNKPPSQIKARRAAEDPDKWRSTMRQ